MKCGITKEELEKDAFGLIDVMKIKDDIEDLEERYNREIETDFDKEASDDLEL